MRVKMLRTLGQDWAEPYREGKFLEGEVVEVDDELAERLLAARLAEDVAKPRPAPVVERNKVRQSAPPEKAS